MKRRSDHEESPFNSPAEMLARVAYVVCLASFMAGVGLTVAGAASHRGLLALGGGASLTVAWLLRGQLSRGDQFESAGNALDTMVGCETPAEEAHLSRLVALLREWDELEQKRGSAGFDPWALQAVRNDIQAIVQSDPALERLFRAHGHAA